MADNLFAQRTRQNDLCPWGRTCGRSSKSQCDGPFNYIIIVVVLIHRSCCLLMAVRSFYGTRIQMSTVLGTFRFNWSVWHTGMHYLSLDRHCLPAPPCHEEDGGGQVNSSVQNRSTRRPYNIIPFSETYYTHRFCAKSYLARQFQGGWGRSRRRRRALLQVSSIVLPLKQRQTDREREIRIRERKGNKNRQWWWCGGEEQSAAELLPVVVVWPGLWSGSWPSSSS